jgi:lipoprotein-anchoring transpeptidase ErfK/SrfK
MRPPSFSLLATLALLGGCAATTMPAPASTEAVAPEPPRAPPLGQDTGTNQFPATPTLSPSQVDAEAARLRAAMETEVPRLITLSPAEAEHLTGLARTAIAASGQRLDMPQLLVVVDRNPAIQEMTIVLARADKPWDVIGTTRVSTGQTGRWDHFVTPTGVFPASADIMGYRALGTFNENHIRGLGVKGMRVWDFGWQTATKGWRRDGEEGQMRLEMHATDPDRLEQRLGRPASEGCIRLSAPVDRFLDRHGIIDAAFERAAINDDRYRALLLPDRAPTPLAGDLLVVVDSTDAG